MIKKVTVAMLPGLLPPNWNETPDLAIVIDTLRFTTTACQALHAGATSIAVAGTVEQARKMQSSTEHKVPPLLCGERHCRKIDGFDLGNSPYEYDANIVGGRDLIFTTTNGTIAVNAVRPASEIFLGSIVNRSAVARAMVSSSAGSVWIVCSGTDGEIALEDVLAAGAIIEASQQNSSIQLCNDSARIALLLWQYQKANLPELLQQSKGGSNLIDSGFQRDLAYSANVDSLSIVPHAKPTEDNRFFRKPSE